MALDEATTAFPAQLAAGGMRPLHEGGADARRLVWAGVQVDRRFDGQMHGFSTMVNVLPGSAAAIDHVVSAFDSRFARQPA
jgi:acetyl esterase